MSKSIKDVRGAAFHVSLAIATGNKVFNSDIMDLVEWFITERPADDGTPVDVAWLDTLQPDDSDSGGEWWNWRYGDDRCFGFISVVSDLPEKPPFSLFVGNVCVCENATRGDLRRLAKALRIDLGEET